MFKLPCPRCLYIRRYLSNGATSSTLIGHVKKEEKWSKLQSTCMANLLSRAVFAGTSRAPFSLGNRIDDDAYRLAAALAPFANRDFIVWISGLSVWMCGGSSRFRGLKIAERSTPLLRIEDRWLRRVVLNRCYVHFPKVQRDWNFGRLMEAFS